MAWAKSTVLATRVSTAPWPLKFSPHIFPPISRASSASSGRFDVAGCPICTHILGDSSGCTSPRLDDVDPRVAFVLLINITEHHQCLGL